jgi:hypothetical protein
MVAPLPSPPLPASPRRELRELLESIAHRFHADPAHDPILPSLLGCLVLHLDEEFHLGDTCFQRSEHRREQTRLLARATDLAAGARRAGTEPEAWDLLALEFADFLCALNANFLAPP